MSTPGKREKWERKDYRDSTFDLAFEGFTPWDPDPANPLGVIHLTDLGNARRLIQHYGADLRHCFPWRKWCHWAGNCWKEDDSGAATRCHKATIFAPFGEAEKKIARIRKELEDNA